MTKNKIVLASDNKHKAEEFHRFFAEHGVDVELLTMRQAGFTGEIVEDADTFEGNAFLKAKAVADAVGLPAMADDSGLEVDALGGKPGVLSARYAGEHGNDQKNIDKLLSELEHVPNEKRTARFVCAICLMLPDGRTFSAKGTSEGLILRERRGSGTFGYDPVFYYPPFGKTFAELDGNLKNQVSHRGRALELLLKNGISF